MFDNLFTKEYYGNTVLDWTMGLGLIVLSVIVARILYWTSTHIFHKLTKRTKTKLDDILVDMIEEPVILLLVLFITWLSLHKVLHFSDSIQFWVDKLYYAAVIFDFAWLIVRTIDALLEHYVKPLTKQSESDMDDLLLPLFRSAFRFMIWTIAIIMGLNNAGYDVGALLAGLGIGGVAVALAAKDTIANVFGGIVVLTGRPFKVGDRIEISNYWAEVKEIGLRATKLEHSDYSFAITIPNSYFLTNNVVNVTAYKGFLFFLDLRLSIKTTPEKLKKAFEIVGEVCARNQKGILKDLRFNDTDNYSFCIRAYVDTIEFKDRHILRSELRLEIHRLFFEHGIEFAEMPNIVTINDKSDKSNKINSQSFDIKDYIEKVKASGTK